MDGAVILIVFDVVAIGCHPSALFRVSSFCRVLPLGGMVESDVDVRAYPNVVDADQLYCVFDLVNVLVKSWVTAVLGITDKIRPRGESYHTPLLSKRQHLLIRDVARVGSHGSRIGMREDTRLRGELDRI